MVTTRRLFVLRVRTITGRPKEVLAIYLRDEVGATWKPNVGTWVPNWDYPGAAPVWYGKLSITDRWGTRDYWVRHWRQAHGAAVAKAFNDTPPP